MKRTLEVGKSDLPAVDIDTLWKDLFGSHSGLVAKKSEVGADLAALVAFVGITRKTFAEKLGWKESRVSTVLSGDENLTLKTIYECCRELGFDFQVAIRTEGQSRFSQPWEQASYFHDICTMHDSANQRLSEATAILNTAQAINRQAFKRLTKTSELERVASRGCNENDMCHETLSATA